MRSAELAERLRRLGARLVAPERPVVAVEVRRRSLAALRLARERGRLALGAAAALELPEGTLRVSLSEPNVADPEAFGRVLASLLERVGVAGGARVALVLPDGCARIALLPDEGRDLEEVARFRLRKLAPFDVREARVATVRLAPVRGAEAAGLVAAVARPVLEGYERAAAQAGLYAGLVELSGLALLRAARAEGDRLLVNWDDGYVTLVLSRQGRPLLVRTLPAALAESLEEVAREVESTLRYHRERLAGGDEPLAGADLRSGAWDPGEAADRLETALGFRPELMAPWSALGAVPPQGGGAALAGAAASLLGEVA